MRTDTHLRSDASSRPGSHIGADMLLPGFTDAVAGAQATFRAALRALSHPGRVQSLDVVAQTCGVPPGLSPAMTALLLSLVDGDTPLWLPAGVDERVRRFLRFHCACQLVDQPSRARFVAVPAGFDAPAMADCDAGDAAYPDRSATMLIEVASLCSGAVVSLRGPGIETNQPLAVDGLSRDFWSQWQVNHRRFPLGVDVLLTCAGQLCGLPRTTVVEN